MTSRLYKKDPVIGELLEDSVGADLFRALKLQYLAGVAMFRPEVTAHMIQKITGAQVPVSKIRARLRKLADGGYIIARKDGRFHLFHLFIGKNGAYYRRRSTLGGWRSDEMIWLADGSLNIGDPSSRHISFDVPDDVSQARVFFKRIAESEDRIVRGEAYHRLALLEAGSGRSEQAQFYYNQAFAHGSNNEFLYCDYAEFKAENGEVAGALKLLREGLITYSGSPAIHELLGRLYETMGDSWRGEFHRFRTMALESMFIPLAAAVADRVADEGELETALALYKKAARSARRNCYPLYRAAYLYVNRLGKPAAAIPIFEKILKIQPCDNLAAKQLAKVEVSKTPLEERVELYSRTHKFILNPARPFTVQIKPLA